jgi:serine-type D-Ala-D-Ala carboxypeptidase/endopeptidase (penicillin-binding protein 4)
MPNRAFAMGLFSSTLFHSLRIGTLVLVLAAGGLPGWAQPAKAREDATGLPTPVLKALASVGVKPAAVFVQVQALPAAGGAAAGRPVTLVSHQAALPAHPASVMKLITTYAALDVLGPDHVWKNQVYVRGTVRQGVLRGDLIVRGSGDPKLVLERMQDLLAQVQAHGVRRIEGDWVLDNSVFDVPVHDAAAFDAEPLRPYNVSPDGLLVNFKSLIFKFVPNAAGTHADVLVEPPIADLAWTQQVPLQAGPCADWRSALKAQFADPERIFFEGRYMVACGAREWPVAYADASRYAPRVFQAMWSASGGELTGQVRMGTLPEQARLLLEAPSLPLSAIIADINKMSNNVMAQQLYLTLSSSLGAPGRFAASELRLQQWWRAHMPGHSPPVLENGSGLSRQERSSAAALGQLLFLAAQGPHASTFMQSLAIAGEDGTLVRLKERMPQSPVLGHAWLKTGSLRDVVAIAGYVQAQSGQRYSVVAIINHDRAPQARVVVETLLDWVVRR